MYADNDGVCVECKCGCHQKFKKDWATISENLKEMLSNACWCIFWCFLVYCMCGGLSR